MCILYLYYVGRQIWVEWFTLAYLKNCFENLLANQENKVIGNPLCVYDAGDDSKIIIRLKRAYLYVLLQWHCRVNLPATPTMHDGLFFLLQ